MANTNITIGAQFPGEALLIKILDLISTQQQIVLTAPEKYRDAYFERLGKMEDFWYKFFEPLGNLIINGIEAAEKEKPKP